MTKLSNGVLFKGYGKMIGAIAKGLDFEKMMDYAITMENKGIIIFGGHESSCSTDNPTYCAKFARGIGEAGGVDWDFNSLRGSASVDNSVGLKPSTPEERKENADSKEKKYDNPDDDYIDVNKEWKTKSNLK